MAVTDDCLLRHYNIWLNIRAGRNTWSNRSPSITLADQVNLRSYQIKLTYRSVTKDDYFVMEGDKNDQLYSQLKGTHLISESTKYPQKYRIYTRLVSNQTVHGFDVMDYVVTVVYTSSGLYITNYRPAN